jgi:outer membrane protein assembly factor BamA
MRILPITALIVLIAAETPAQDLSSFYAISGFRLPALRTGQYYLSLSPHYLSHPSDDFSMYSLSSAENTSTGQGSGSYTYSTFGLSADFTYGISDLTTISAYLGYNPDQATGRQDYNSVYTSTPSYSSTSNASYEFKEEAVSSALVLAHRFQPNLEFSVSASWTSYKRPSSGTRSESSTSGGVTATSSGPASSANNQHYVAISATIVILGY